MSSPIAEECHDGPCKSFVLDTNVLLHNPAALFMFTDNEVVIPFTVLEELDRFKKQTDDVGRNARQVIRHLDRLRCQGQLTEGVPWNKEGGRIRVDFTTDQRPKWLQSDAPDNRIIGVAWSLAQRGHPTVLISKDINVRLKSDALGIHTEDFEAQKVDADHLYSGYTRAVVPGTLIDSLYAEKQLNLSEILPHLADANEDHAQEVFPEIIGNQFVLLTDSADESHTGLSRRLADTDQLVPVFAPRKPVFGIMARNVQQTMAFDLLLDDEVALVTLLGSAGTGKLYWRSPRG